jgi:endoglycosylceramidase
MFYEPYLAYYVDRDVRWAKKYGLYIVLDMHQDNWATKFGGGGAPDWAVQKYPPTESGMRQAVSDFWNSSTLQDHLITVWTKIAKRYANEPTVAGYDIVNEPWIYRSINQNLNASHVDAFCAKAIPAIRRVDVNHLIFLEPANLHTPTFPLKDNIVWAPHFYQLSFAVKYYPANITVFEADFVAKYRRFVLDMGGPMWVGEFGAFMRDSASSHRWLQDAIRIFDRYQVGWAWWAFCQTGDQSIPSILSVTNP